MNIITKLSLLFLFTGALAISALGIAFTYVQPPSIKTEQLQPLARYLKYVDAVWIVLAFILGALIHLNQNFRESYTKWNIKTHFEKKTWYFKTCQILMSLSVIFIIFSLAPLGTHFENGHWLAGGGKGGSWNIVLKPEATILLYRELRIYVLFFCFILLACILLLLSSIRQLNCK